MVVYLVLGLFPLAQLVPFVSSESIVPNLLRAKPTDSHLRPIFRSIIHSDPYTTT